MKQQSRSVITTSSVLAFIPPKSIKASYSSRLIALVLMIIFAPVYLINVVVSLIKDDKVMQATKERDALGRTVLVHQFKQGIFRKSGLLVDVVSGRIDFCGVGLTHLLPKAAQREILRDYQSTPGLFSLYDLHKSSGLAISDDKALLIKQLSAGAPQRYCLLLKSILCICLFSLNLKVLKTADKISLFGLDIHNSSMQDAVNWVTQTHEKPMPNVGFFVNVNSINLGVDAPQFNAQLQQADALFADGSGLRLAAHHIGYRLRDNINGTDMLPHLCLSCVTSQKSVFLLGAKPGVAMQAAVNLKKTYPQLKIVGVEHGYSAHDNMDDTITHINNSGCDVLLVAMGSPIQESWVLTHRNALTCQTVLAVGGLFDFYAGEISRSPMWLRELGMEWIWRLIQEPKAKFRRYVIGNPVFLFRLFILGLATKGAKS